MTKQAEENAAARAKPDRLWPMILTLGLVVVVVVNGIFIYMAFSGADDVDPAYVEGTR